MYNNYIIQNFLTHYQNNIFQKYLYTLEPTWKTTKQKNFELYMKSRGIIVVDYIRLFVDQKYFDILSKIAYKYSDDKQCIIYVAIDQTYKSEKSILPVWNIPDDCLSESYKFLYDYLFNPISLCVSCSDKNVHYFCHFCGVYYCYSCILNRLHWLYQGGFDHGYIRCNCGKRHFMYKIPNDV